MFSPLKVGKPRDLQRTFKNVKNKVEKNNGTFAGNLENGSVSCVGVTGTYKVTDDAIEIAIMDKPRLYPEFVVKKAIEKIFQDCSA